MKFITAILTLCFVQTAFAHSEATNLDTGATMICLNPVTQVRYNLEVGDKSLEIGTVSVTSAGVTDTFDAVVINREFQWTDGTGTPHTLSISETGFWKIKLATLNDGTKSSPISCLVQ